MTQSELPRPSRAWCGRLWLSILILTMCHCLLTCVTMAVQMRFDEHGKKYDYHFPKFGDRLVYSGTTCIRPVLEWPLFSVLLGSVSTDSESPYLKTVGSLLMSKFICPITARIPTEACRVLTIFPFILGNSLFWGIVGTLLFRITQSMKVAQRKIGSEDRKSVV